MQQDQSPGLRTLALNPKRAAPQLTQAGSPPRDHAILAWKLPLAKVWGFHTGSLGPHPTGHHRGPRVPNPPAPQADAPCLAAGPGQGASHTECFPSLPAASQVLLRWRALTHWDLHHPRRPASVASPVTLTTGSGDGSALQP